MAQTDAEILISREAMDPSSIEAELEALAQRYQSAGRHGVQLMNALGNKAEAALTRLPSPARVAVEKAIRQALILSLRGAGHSRRIWPRATRRLEPHGHSRTGRSGRGYRAARGAD